MQALVITQPHERTRGNNASGGRRDSLGEVRTWGPVALADVVDDVPGNARFPRKLKAPAVLVCPSFQRMVGHYRIWYTESGAASTGVDGQPLSMRCIASGARESNDHSVTRQTKIEAPDHATLGARFTAARKGKGLSITDVAKALETKWQAVQEWEQGKRMPRFEQGIRLARLLGMTLDELLDEGYQPPYAAWPTFVASQQMTDGEKRQLASFMWGDSEPTIEAYSVVLAGLRLAKRGA
jgi:transcriptional regulator with XRE-family HTH domain